MAKRSSPAAFQIAETQVPPGSRVSIKFPAARLYTDTPIELHAEVFHGVKKGPVLLVCAAIHGDELNGVEICRRLLGLIDPTELVGTVIVVPVVNIFGFIQQSRYLPDRRDLNRCFPGSERGALGSRLAYLFNDEIVSKASHIIDLHTGAMHRSNLPQIRVDTSQAEALAMADAFSAPVILQSKRRDGSLRALAGDLNIPLIVYEAGEALRFDDAAIHAGVNGVTNVMKFLKMMKGRKRRAKVTPVLAPRSVWVRNEFDGLVIRKVELGQTIAKGQIIAEIVNPHRDQAEALRSPCHGIVIGISNIPVSNEGEALFNIAQFDRSEVVEAGENVDTFTEAYEGRPL
ncbi:succinylglutamate desuccinylase/aspartoacylase family protein [Pseudidiomarina taiwanensis]|uniref:Succinylglutamate desuccinylase n=1 Tax=Pseudidiomarina taiwanensis TaxID=337250 RepID=A0A432ZKQ2_9GAMM|nr:succinylglutamate desuccinylase/aspartoacylase family protein [Pseudidiomarina taiwanensis]RUO78474.1 succinylglutamate desuccinylase [Pseudidiomarina taiwanensis]